MADIKLLLVEDDENLAYMEKSCFEDIIEGYEVKTAVNGRQGLEEWKNLSARCHRIGYRHAYHGRSGDGEENT